MGRKVLSIERTLEICGVPPLQIQMNSEQHLCTKKLLKAGETKDPQGLKLTVLGTHTGLRIMPVPVG